MKPFRYTPYADGRKPFTIGLQPLDPADWIEVDGNLDRYLAEKRDLFSNRHDTVFQARSDTVAAQQETLDLFAGYLPERHPDVYRREADAIRILRTGETVPLDHADRPPLETAARLIQDDLVIMRKGERGYELVAAAVCFPSSWRLADKFGRPLAEIHAPVPGYDGRMARRMDLIFDRLPHDRIVWRTNWSVYGTDNLADFRTADSFDSAGRFEFDGAFLRVERQTLRRLPVSGDLLFTIMILIDPLRRLRDHPDSAALAGALRNQLLALDDAQLAYKALTGRRRDLADYLVDVASGTAA